MEGHLSGVAATLFLLTHCTACLADRTAAAHIPAPVTLLSIVSLYRLHCTASTSPLYRLGTTVPQLYAALMERVYEERRLIKESLSHNAAVRAVEAREGGGTPAYLLAPTWVLVLPEDVL